MSIMQAATGVSTDGLLVIGTIGDSINLHVAFGFGAVMMLVDSSHHSGRSHWRTAIDGRDQVATDHRVGLNQ
jgi:hypothetical protein